MKLESEIQQLVQIESAKYGCVLERNNSGAFTDQTGRTVRFGLGNISAKHAENLKSSDLIGITTIVVTPEMIGKKLGVFTAFEIKKEDWKMNKNFDKREQAQANYLEYVRNHGGIAAFVNDVDQIRMILKR
jgi:hypothetical protein